MLSAYLKFYMVAVILLLCIVVDGGRVQDCRSSTQENRFTGYEKISWDLDSIFFKTECFWSYAYYICTGYNVCTRIIG